MSSLSKSDLWIKMQDYYNNIGPEAWQDELVPLQISSNKNLALAYANVIVAQINDWHAKNPQTNEPFYIVEIGTGHGKLSFYILKFLEKLLKNYSLPLNTVKFIMTDIAEKNLESWEQHAALKPWVAAGVLDYAVFNAMSDQEIKLKNSGLTIQKGNLNKPIFMICNYLFDSLSHDAFVVRDHKLFEVQIKISSDADWADYFAKAKFKYDYLPIDRNYYQDENLNKILDEYQKLNDCTFMIPVGGVDCINTVKSFSKQHLVLLLADKGHATPDLFDEDGEPDISVHGSISLMVNFDALKQYFANINGCAMLMQNQSVDFQVACYCTEPKDPIPHTKNTFEQMLSGASPQDIVNLCYVDDEVNTNFKNLDQVLAILNLTMWDPNIFYDLHETILDKIEEEDINVEQDKALLHGTALACEFFFKLEKTQDLPFAAAGIYYALDEYEKAVEFYQLSIREFGANAENLYNLAIAYQELEENSSALEAAKKSLELDPKYAPAKELIKELMEELADA